MTINHKQLIGLRVETENKDHLGKVCGIEIDTTNHLVVKYEVKTNKVIDEIFGKHLLISPDQVVGIDEEKMVVKNAVSKDAEARKHKKTTPLKRVAPIVN